MYRLRFPNKEIRYLIVRVSSIVPLKSHYTIEYSACSAFTIIILAIARYQQQPLQFAIASMQTK